MNLDFQDAQRGPKKRGSKKTGLQSQFCLFIAGRGKEEETSGKSPAQKRRGVAGKRKQAEKAPRRIGGAWQGRGNRRKKPI